MDRFGLPMLGRRRGWMLATQLLLLAAIPVFGVLYPQQDIWAIAYLAVAVAFFSASQDIVLDAFRREILPEAEFGLGNAVYVNAYKISSLIPGSLALILSDLMPWSSVFLVTALFMLPGIVLTLSVREPQLSPGTPRTLREAIVEPFHEFVTRAGGRRRCSFCCSSSSTSWATAWPRRWPPLLPRHGLFADRHRHHCQECGTVGERDRRDARWAVDGEDRHQSRAVAVRRGPAGLHPGLRAASLGQPAGPAAAGLRHRLRGAGRRSGTAAFVAFIARATDPRYTATQFALFTSLAAVPATIITASTGWIVDATGWFLFFLLWTPLALPGMALLLRVAPWHDRAKEGARP